MTPTGAAPRVCPGHPRPVPRGPPGLPRTSPPDQRRQAAGPLATTGFVFLVAAAGSRRAPGSGRDAGRKPPFVYFYPYDL